PRIDFALDGNFHFETVSVHAPAFVALRRFGQSLCRFKREIFGQSRAHNQTPRSVGRQINLCIWSWKRTFKLSAKIHSKTWRGSILPKIGEKSTARQREGRS